jgi:predicted metal-binding protein
LSGGYYSLSLEDLRVLAVKLGGKNAKILRAEDVIVADWVRLKCMYGCDGYGRSLTCPPYSPTPEETRRMLRSYEYCILVEFPSEADTHRIMAELEREAFLAGYYSAFAMPAGPCELCGECTLKNCRYPEIARPSMEACGIDVYATARKAGFDIKPLKSRGEIPKYFGLLLAR